MLTHHTTTSQGGEHVLRAVEVRQFDVRCADAFGIVRVGANAGRNVEAVHEVRRLEVVPLVSDFGVEDFDNIQLVRTSQRLEGAQLESGTLGVERVRRVDQAALRPDPLHDIRDRQNVRDPLRQVQSDELAGRRPDFFTDNDASTDVAHEYLRQLGEVDAVVIGDAHDIELRRLDALDQLVECGARIARRRRVQMTIEAYPASWGRSRRPGRHQHRKGDYHG
jgi:hypothetical protein